MPVVLCPVTLWHLACPLCAFAPNISLGLSGLGFCSCLWAAQTNTNLQAVLAVGVSGLEVKIGGKPRSYALLVADTVVVKEGGAAPEVLTAACNKAWSDVAYFFKVTTFGARLQLTNSSQILCIADAEDGRSQHYHQNIILSRSTHALLLPIIASLGSSYMSFDCVM